MKIIKKKKNTCFSREHFSVQNSNFLTKKKVAEAEEDTGNGFFPLEIMTLI